MKVIEYNNPKVGCYIDESAGSADDCNRRTIKFAEAYGFQAEKLDKKSEDYSENLAWDADEAVDYLNGLEARSFMFWQFEDNSLFLMADVDSAREEVGFVTSTTQEYPADDYQGEWLHVSDHGNATLYVRENGEDTEIWGVV